MNDNKSKNEINTNNSWEEHRLYVLNLLNQLSDKINELEKESMSNKIDQTNDMFELKENTQHGLAQIVSYVTKLIIKNSIINIIVSTIISLLLLGSTLVIWILVNK